MGDTLPGVIIFVILMTLVFAASRVLVRFTGARFSRAMAPLAPVIGGGVSTHSLSDGWLEGAYHDRKVHATAIPGVAPDRTSAKEERYNAFEVAVYDVAGASDWTVTFGSHSVGQIITRDESWRFSADDPALQQRLEASPLTGELEGFAGAGVRGSPTVMYSAGTRRLTHRDSVGPGIAPSPEHFRKQLDLALRLAHISEQVNPAAS